MGKFIDLTGQKFGRLTVIKMIDERKKAEEKYFKPYLDKYKKGEQQC